MKIDFTGRGIDATQAIRKHTEAKLDRLKKHLDDINDVTVVLSSEKYRQRAEIKFLSSKQAFYGQEETSDIKLSIDRVVEKLEKQVRRFKEKRLKKKRKSTESIKVNVVSVAEQEEPEPEEKIEPEIKIIKTNNFVVKPMSLEEAVQELQKLNQEFIIFQNAESEAMNVVYKRKDGHFGYIEPSF